MLRGIASNHNGDFYCLNCFQSLRTKNKPKKQLNVWKNHYYCYAEMPKKERKLKYNPGQKSI